MTKILSAKEIEQLKTRDFEGMNATALDSIAKNSVRNNVIVQHYIEHKEKYGQTIVFALNVANAIALQTVFNRNGIKTDYVICGGVTTDEDKKSTSQENIQKIKRFRDGKTQVLINYNILTEGIDIPSIQTVFIARPTHSKIVMTQMIGRGLRGVKAGGTKEAFIVSFIDNWHNKIAWVTPKQIEIGREYIEKVLPKAEYLVEKISVQMSQQFALISDTYIDKPEIKVKLESKSFIERLPIGIYVLPITFNNNINESASYDSDRETTVLVLSNLSEQYQNFVSDLPNLVTNSIINQLTSPFSADDILENLIDQAYDQYFNGSDISIGCERSDIGDIIRYYACTEEIPILLPWESREKYDMDKFAEKLFKAGMSPYHIKCSIDDTWELDADGWRTFFGCENKTYFRNEIFLALKRLTE